MDGGDGEFCGSEDTACFRDGKDVAGGGGGVVSEEPFFRDSGLAFGLFACGYGFVGRLGGHFGRGKRWC